MVPAFLRSNAGHLGSGAFFGMSLLAWTLTVREYAAFRCFTNRAAPTFRHSPSARFRHARPYTTLLSFAFQYAWQKSR
jgi:hypothetical protein